MFPLSECSGEAGSDGSWSLPLAEVSVSKQKSFKPYADTKASARLVQLMKGDIHVKSSQGEHSGTTFSFYLLCVPAKAVSVYCWSLSKFACSVEPAEPVVPKQTASVPIHQSANCQARSVLVVEVRQALVTSERGNDATCTG